MSTTTTIEVNIYKFSATIKANGTVRFDTFRIADRMGVGDWVVLNQDGTVNSSARRQLPDDVMAEMRQALNIVLTGEVPNATYSLGEVLKGTPARSLYDLGDKELIDAVQARFPQVPLVGSMSRYVIRNIRAWGKARGAYGEPTEKMLGDLVQEAWEDNAYRE